MVRDVFTRLYQTAICRRLRQGFCHHQDCESLRFSSTHGNEHFDVCNYSTLILGIVLGVGCSRGEEQPPPTNGNLSISIHQVKNAYAPYALKNFNGFSIEKKKHMFIVFHHNSTSIDGQIMIGLRMPYAKSQDLVGSNNGLTCSWRSYPCVSI